jgi:hypothetical protein
LGRATAPPNERVRRSYKCPPQGMTESDRSLGSQRRMPIGGAQKTCKLVWWCLVSSGRYQFATDGEIFSLKFLIEQSNSIQLSLGKPNQLNFYSIWKVMISF